MAKFTVCLFLCLIFVHSGYGLKCYSCDSQKNSACNDPANTEKIPANDCSVPPGASAMTTASCMKMWTEDNHTGVSNITRKCVTSPKNTDACRTASAGLDVTHIKLHHCSLCELDMCNGSGKPGAPGYTVVALTAAALALILRI